MTDSTEEMTRRILESVLRQLESGAGRAAITPAIHPADHQSAGGAPIIVILLGEQHATPAALPVVAQQSGGGCQNNSPDTGKNSLQSLHPGLERFDLRRDLAVSNAPRRCDLEPDRECVGSGACEMRGY
jgi:hypothetical protein